MSIQAGWNAALGSIAVLGRLGQYADMQSYEQETKLYNDINDFHKSFDEAHPVDDPMTFDMNKWESDYKDARTEFERTHNVEGMPRNLRKAYNKAMERYMNNRFSDAENGLHIMTPEEVREISDRIARNNPATTSAIDPTPDYDITAANIGNFSAMPGQDVASRIASMAPEAAARQQAIQAAQVADSAPVNNMSGVREGLTRSMSSRQVLDSVHRMERGGLD